MSKTCARASIAAALFVVFSICAAARSGEVVSTMRNVNAVAEAHGFRLNPAFDMVGVRGPDEKGEPQAFEVLRPLDQSVTLGRIYTSCTCIQLVAAKRTFEPGERAVLHLRNIKETPVNGQIYAIYVQIASPVRTTLRFDTFVQSNSLINPEVAEGEDPEGDGAEGEAGEEEGEAAAAPAAAAATATAAAAAPSADAEDLTADAFTADEMPEMPGIEIIVPGAATAAVAAAEAEMEAEEAASAAVAATASAVAAESAASAAEVAAAEAALAAAREELAAIMSTRSEDLTAGVGAGDVVREEIDSFFASGAGAARAPVAAASAAPAADSGWQVVAAAPATAAGSARAAPAAPTSARAPATAAAASAAAARAVSLITLGVRDMARSAAFYEAIGWQRAARSKYDAAAFFQLHGQVLALYPIADMLREQGMPDARPAPGGIVLALHVATPEEVQREFDRFVAAGGTALKEPAALPGGAVTGYVADPDGNPWEISCVPQFVLDGEGGLWLR